MDFNQLTEDLVAKTLTAKQAQERAVPVTGGGETKAPNQRMLEFYAKKGLAIPFHDPAALMGYIDTMQKQWSQWPTDGGSANFAFPVKIAKDALSDIYGINDYVTQGFAKRNPETGNFEEYRGVSPTMEDVRRKMK